MVDTTPEILIYAIVGILLVSVIVFVTTQSIMSVLVVLTLVCILAYVLNALGILKIRLTKDDGLDVGFYESIPAPAPPPKQIIPVKIEKNEVFYVSGNDYTYNDAPAVCAAYNADLATYDQVNEAFSQGAEWCGYGWTFGGMALFPTQESTWQSMQMEMTEKKRTACGRPGINGGYFDPSNKFGVNCYGVKPRDKERYKFPLPVPGTDSNGFNRLVDKFKGMLNRMKVSPFNRDGWSEYNADAHGLAVRSLDDGSGSGGGGWPNYLGGDGSGGLGDYGNGVADINWKVVDKDRKRHEKARKDTSFMMHEKDDKKKHGKK